MTNKERAAIIRRFFNKCRADCQTCPCNGTLCGDAFTIEARKNFALEVADILEGKPIKVKVRKHNENRN